MLTNTTLELRSCRIYTRRVLEKLVAEKPSSILLLTDPERVPEEADARTLVLQLHLTDEEISKLQASAAKLRELLDEIYAD